VCERESISLPDYNNPKHRWCETRAFRYMTPTPLVYDRGTMGVLFSALAASQSQSFHDIRLRDDIILAVRDRVDTGDIPRRGANASLWDVLVANGDVLDWLSSQSKGFRLIRSPSLGREPRRGLMGKAIPRTGHAIWPEGFDWL
jgi:hypothetical protein